MMSPQLCSPMELSTKFLVSGSKSLWMEWRSFVQQTGQGGANLVVVALFHRADGPSS
jgi:hypothetical protein